MVKRTNKTGSITKVNKKLKKPYLVRVWVNGERKTLGYFQTLNEAKKELEAFNFNPFDLEGSTLNFKELYDIFIRSKKETVSESTFRGYGFKFKHCEPIHSILLKDLKTPVIQELINKINLSTGSKREIKGFIVMLLEFAVQMEYVPLNRAKAVKLSKHKPVKEKNKFTAEEIKIIWQHKDLLGAKAILIMLYTGMRIGEVVRIKKENVDFINNVIRDFGNKTEKSKKRFIPIHRDIQELIKELYDTSPTDYLLSAWSLRSRKTNTPVHIQTIRRHFNQLMESLGMKHTSHDARGTFASILNKKGINKTIITDLMGHSDFKTTQEYYIENDEETIKDTIEKIDILN